MLYTRVNDVFDTPLEKAQMGNQSGADYFISIHRNAMPIPGSASGAEVLVYEDEGVPALLAENISRNLTEAGFADLGVKERPGLIVLRRTQMPAVPNVLECNCVTGEYSMLMKVAFQSTMDLDIFIGQLQKFGKTSTQIVFSTQVGPRGVDVDEI